MTIVESGCGNQYVGVVISTWMWLIGGISGCGYQEMGVVRMYRCG